MIILFTCALGLTSLISYVHYKHLFNPITLMFGLWTIIIPLSSQIHYGIAVTDYTVYIIIAIGLLAYLIGVTLSNERIRFTFGAPRIRKISSEEEYYINYRFLYIISIIALLYYLIIVIRLIPYFRTGNLLAVVRQMAVSEEKNELESSFVIVFLKNYIATPTSRLLIAILPIEWFLGRRDKWIIVLSIMIFVLDVLTTGGRSSIILLVEFFVCIYTIKLKKDGKVVFKGKLSFGKKICLLGVGLLLFYFLLQTTYSRKGAGVNIVRQVFIYYVAPIKYFEYNKHVVDTLYSNFWGLGTASLYGFFYPFLYLFKIIGLYSEYPNIFLVARWLSFNMLQETVHLGGAFYMNAFATMFFQPYIDGRILGVVILCFLLGLFTGLSYKKAVNNGNLKWLLIYLLFFQKVINSEVRFYFTMPTHAICLLFALFAIRRERKPMDQSSIGEIERRVE